jgi:hypothetical protein
MASPLRLHRRVEILLLEFIIQPIHISVNDGAVD